MSDKCNCGFDHWPLPCKSENPPNEMAESSFAAPSGSAAGVEQEAAALRTYRRIWVRLPKHVRDEQMGMMKCWSPPDYDVMVAEEKRQNYPAQRPPT